MSIHWVPLDPRICCGHRLSWTPIVIAGTKGINRATTARAGGGAVNHRGTCTQCKGANSVVAIMIVRSWDTRGSSTVVATTAASTPRLIAASVTRRADRGWSSCACTYVFTNRRNVLRTLTFTARPPMPIISGARLIVGLQWFVVDAGGRFTNGSNKLCT